MLPSRSRALVACLSAVLVSCTLTACSRPGLSSEFRPSETKIFGYSVEGRPIKGRIIGDGPRTALLFGVIHGNEPLGLPLLTRLEGYLREHPRLLTGRRVILVPVVNPDGLVRGTRTNANGIDLNRNFPSSCFAARANHGARPGSEPETRALLRIVDEYRPDQVLSIHSPLNCVNFDGPAEELACRIADATGLPVRDSVGYPTPGAFGRYIGTDMQVPSITLELGSNLSATAAWHGLRDGFVAFLRNASEPDNALTSGSRARRYGTGK